MAAVMGNYREWTWVVPTPQFDSYVEAGAERVIGVPSTQVTHQRQWVIDTGRAEQQTVCMVDDDLRKLVWMPMVKTDPELRQTILLEQAVDIIEAQLVARGSHLGGIGPTNNAFFVKKEVQDKLFIRSGLLVVRPTEIDYDHNLMVKEDYDFTCQHLALDGAVVRYDAILATFQQRTNGGGCQDYRTPSIESMAVEYLCKKWPDAIKPHATRANEVSLRWK